MGINTVIAELKRYEACIANHVKYENPCRLFESIRNVLQENQKIISSFVQCEDCQSHGQCFIENVFDFTRANFKFCGAGVRVADAKPDLEFENIMKRLDEYLSQDILSDCSLTLLDLIDQKLREQRRILMHTVRCEDCILHDSCTAEDSFIYRNVSNKYCCMGKKK